MEWSKLLRPELRHCRYNSSWPKVNLNLLYPCIVLFIIATACDKPVKIPVEKDSRYAKPGMIRSVEQIDSYSKMSSRLLLWWVDLDDELPVEFDINLYRIEYWTTGPGGELTFASGLVALPENPTLRGVVSWQHGTQTLRNDVPSSPSTKDGILTSIAFAGHGYLLAAPDYFGLGTSPGIHPYLHSESEANATIDLLKAAKKFVGHLELEWPEALFLTGFSQGGHASVAAQRTLEAQPVKGLRVTASAPIAGLYNLSDNQFPFALEGSSKAHSAYLAYIGASYSQVYNEPLSSVFSENYSKEIPTIFKGTLSFAETIEKFPSSPAQMFHQKFLSSLGTEENWFTKALAENSVHDWVPRAPVQFYYGSGDRDSMPADTQRTVQQMAARRGNVTAVDVGDTDHNATVIAAVPRVRNWFDQLLKENKRLVKSD